MWRLRNILRPKLGVVADPCGPSGLAFYMGWGLPPYWGDLGLAQGQFILSLIAFNIGVELGQLAVIAAAFVLFALPLGRSAIYRRVVVIPGSVAIAFVGPVVGI